MSVNKIYLFRNNLFFLINSNYFNSKECLEVYNLIHGQESVKKDFTVNNKKNIEYPISKSIAIVNKPEIEKKKVSQIIPRNRIKIIIKKKKELSKSKVSSSENIIFKTVFKKSLFNNNINFKFPDFTVLNTQHLQEILERI